MDINTLRAKVKQLEEGKPKSKKWKPKDKHTVRLLPIPEGDDIAFVIKWHYGVDGNRAMACPDTWGDQCDFCDLTTELRSWKGPDGKDKSEADRKKDWEWVKKIGAATKHYSPMVERTEKNGTSELQGPFLWEMTPKSYTALLKVCALEDYNEDHPEGGALKVLTSTKHGLDLVVELKKAGEKGNQTSYDLTEITERRKGSLLTKDGDKAVAEILAKVPKLEDIASPVTSEQASKVFKAWKASLSKEPAEGGDTGVEYNDSANGEEQTKGGADVDATVAKLESLLGKRS